MPYTYNEAARYFHGSESTLRRKIRKLEAQKKFTKAEKLFSETEMKKLSKLLGFTFIPAVLMNGNGNGKH